MLGLKRSTEYSIIGLAPFLGLYFFFFFVRSCGHCCVFPLRFFSHLSGGKSSHTPILSFGHFCFFSSFLSFFNTYDNVIDSHFLPHLPLRSGGQSFILRFFFFRHLLFSRLYSILGGVGNGNYKIAYDF